MSSNEQPMWRKKGTRRVQMSYRTCHHFTCMWLSCVMWLNSWNTAQERVWTERLKPRQRLLTAVVIPRLLPVRDRTSICTTDCSRVTMRAMACESSVALNPGPAVQHLHRRYGPSPLRDRDYNICCCQRHDHIALPLAFSLFPGSSFGRPPECRAQTELSCVSILVRHFGPH